jgi:hypothetical protein
MQLEVSQWYQVAKEIHANLQERTPWCQKNHYALSLAATAWWGESPWKEDELTIKMSPLIHMAMNMTT